MRKRRYLAILVSMCLVTGVFGTCSKNIVSAEPNSDLRDKSFQRVLTRNNDGLLRYTYEDTEGS